MMISEDQIEKLLDETLNKSPDSSREKIKALLLESLAEKEPYSEPKEKKMFFFLALFLFLIVLFQLGSFLFIEREISSLKEIQAERTESQKL